MTGPVPVPRREDAVVLGQRRGRSVPTASAARPRATSSPSRRQIRPSRLRRGGWRKLAAKAGIQIRQDRQRRATDGGHGAGGGVVSPETAAPLRTPTRRGATCGRATRRRRCSPIPVSGGRRTPGMPLAPCSPCRTRCSPTAASGSSCGQRQHPVPLSSTSPKRSRSGADPGRSRGTQVQELAGNADLLESRARSTVNRPRPTSSSRRR